jgi:hypothetical protein
VLCPHWWDEDRTVSLEKKLRQVEGDKTAQQTMETWKGVRSRSLLHETYHWDFQQDVEKLDDWETDPLDVAYKAKMLGTEHSRKNVESYAISARKSSMELGVLSRRPWSFPVRFQALS